MWEIPIYFHTHPFFYINRTSILTQKKGSKEEKMGSHPVDTNVQYFKYSTLKIYYDLKMTFYTRLRIIWYHIKIP